MKKLLSILFALLNLMPSIVIICSFLFSEIILSWFNNDVRLYLEWDGLVRFYSALVFFIMLFFNLNLLYFSKDINLKGKKALWVSILMLGNIISAPFFWYFYVRNWIK